MENITQKYEQELFDYLDELRDSGVTNMFGAGAYLQRDFGLSRRQSHEVLQAWMKSFMAGEA